MILSLFQGVLWAMGILSFLLYLALVGGDDLMWMWCSGVVVEVVMTATCVRHYTLRVEYAQSTRKELVRGVRVR